MLNFGLRSLGLDPIAWLSSTKWAMPAVIIMGVWGILGEGMIIFLAGLQSISQSYYETPRWMEPMDGKNCGVSRCL